MPGARGMLARVVGVRTPVLQATVERRLLLTYRFDPDVAVFLVPGPFSLQLINGFGVGVICLDRVTSLRPRRLPAAVGLSFEHASHRIAVEWDQGGRQAAGVFVLMRHSSSRMAVATGDRFFPGRHERADFEVADHAPDLRVAFRSRDGGCTVDAAVGARGELVGSALFPSTDDAWRFFRRGAVSYSLRRRGGTLDGLDLRTKGGRVEAAVIDHVESSVFDDSSVFPPGAAIADSALVVRDLGVEWHPAPPPRSNHQRPRQGPGNVARS